MAHWKLDDQFRVCRDTFPIGTILSVVDFVENYTYQPHREIQSQYYHSDQVSIMLHITYRHRVDSTNEKMVILKGYHFYISDDRCHELDFLQHNFHLFYNHLKDNNMQMEQHWILYDGCAGQLKNACLPMVVYSPQEAQGATYLELF